MALVGWLHLRLFQLVALLIRGLLYLFVKVPVEGAVRLTATVLAWLHIMVRLWLGVFAFGALAFVAASALVKLSPPGSNWRLVALLVCLLWLVGLFSAARFTMEYLSYRRVRQSQAFGEMRQGIQDLKAGQRVLEGAARATRDTPVGGAFKSNRTDRDRAEAESAAARRQAEAEAEAARRRAEADDLRRDELAALEPDPFESMEVR